MITSAYNQNEIYNLKVIKLAKRWLKHGMIETRQFQSIEDIYKTPLFHPNLAIRLLLFIATVIVIVGVSGLVFLMFSDSGESVISIVAIVFGVGAFAVLEKVFIDNRHYKSGVNESIIYIASGFIIVGVGILTNFESMFLIQLVAMGVFAFAAIRYLDWMVSLGFVVMLSWTIFFQCDEAGELLKSVIPFVFIVTFSSLLFIIRKLKKRRDLVLWNDNMLILEACCLLLVYAGGNYLVVREVSISFMNMELLDGQDIPYAFLFYSLTIVLPILYTGFGIMRKDIVWIRLGLVTMAFTIYTFKHYFLPGNSEVFLVVMGMLSSALAVIGMRYLKDGIMGLTSENIFSAEWANLNVEAFIISQTTGGNQPEKAEISGTGGGGSTGGGGASSSF